MPWQGALPDLRAENAMGLSITQPPPNPLLVGAPSAWVTLRRVNPLRIARPSRDLSPRACERLTQSDICEGAGRRSRTCGRERAQNAAVLARPAPACAFRPVTSPATDRTHRATTLERR